MDTSALRTKLIEKYPDSYSEENVEEMIEKIVNMDLNLRADLENYLEIGIEPMVEIEGYTVGKLKEDHSMNEVSAMLTLDWMKKDPQNAKASLVKTGTNL